jgi:hypothetical protein
MALRSVDFFPPFSPTMKVSIASLSLVPLADEAVHCWRPISLDGRRLIEAFERLGPQHPFPRAITVDNGTEFTCKVGDE